MRCRTAQIDLEHSIAQPGVSLISQKENHKLGRQNRWHRLQKQNRQAKRSLHKKLASIFSYNPYLYESSRIICVTYLDHTINQDQRKFSLSILNHRYSREARHPIFSSLPRISQMSQTKPLISHVYLPAYAANLPSNNFYTKQSQSQQTKSVQNQRFSSS